VRARVRLEVGEGLDGQSLPGGEGERERRALGWVSWAGGEYRPAGLGLAGGRGEEKGRGGREGNGPGQKRKRWRKRNAF
jgi:hypothetical protein